MLNTATMKRKKNRRPSPDKKNQSLSKQIKGKEEPRHILTCRHPSNKILDDHHSHTAKLENINQQDSDTEKNIPEKTIKTCQTYHVEGVVKWFFDNRTKESHPITLDITDLHQNRLYRKTTYEQLFQPIYYHPEYHFKGLYIYHTRLSTKQYMTEDNKPFTLTLLAGKQFQEKFIVNVNTALWADHHVIQLKRQINNAIDNDLTQHPRKKSNPKKYAWLFVLGTPTKENPRVFQAANWIGSIYATCCIRPPFPWHNQASKKHTVHTYTTNNHTQPNIDNPVSPSLVEHPTSGEEFYQALNQLGDDTQAITDYYNNFRKEKLKKPDYLKRPEPSHLAKDSTKTSLLKENSMLPPKDIKEKQLPDTGKFTKLLKRLFGIK